jgi:hypothetical protein
MPRSALLLLFSLLSTAALAAGPGQVGGPGSPMGAMAEAATPCPAGWTQQGKVQRGGGFSCAPAKGSPAAAPEMALACPANTRYFVKGRRLGCEAITKAHAKAHSKASAKAHNKRPTAQGKTS